MDPVETRDVRVIQARGQVERILEALDSAVAIHDFRMVSGEERVNLIFDMDHNCGQSGHGFLEHPHTPRQNP